MEHEIDKNMATLTKNRRKSNRNLQAITLLYDSKNSLAQNTIDYILTMGVFEKKLTPFEEALDDIKQGRITRINDPANIVEECLR